MWPSPTFYRILLAAPKICKAFCKKRKEIEMQKKEKEMDQANGQQGTSNKRSLPSQQNTQFKMPRKVRMFDYLKESFTSL